MSVESFRRAADAAGIVRASYSVTGGLPDDTYVACRESDGGWCVYFAERGQRVNEVRFASEDEALSELLLRLLKDPSTRQF